MKSVKKNIEGKRSDLHTHEFQDQQGWRKHRTAEGGSAESSSAAADNDREDCLRSDQQELAHGQAQAL